MIRYPKGVLNPQHTHPCGHGIFVLEGHLRTHRAPFGPGTWVWFPKGEEMQHGATDGGKIETSSKNVLQTGGKVDARGVTGAAGEWLLDPSDILIQATNTSGGSFSRLAAVPNRKARPRPATSPRAATACGRSPATAPRAWGSRGRRGSTPAPCSSRAPDPPTPTPPTAGPPHRPRPAPRLRPRSRVPRAGGPANRARPKIRPRRPPGSGAPRVYH